MSPYGKSRNEITRIRKPGLSCAECRRSKLKCDRIFPCQACIRRGCAGICPGGALNATKGNKVLQAHAEKQADEIEDLKFRIRELENALRVSQASVAKASHSEDPSEIDALYEKGFEVVSERMGSLSIGTQGQANYHGESAATEYLKELLPLEEDGDHPERLVLPQELLELTNAFPFGLFRPPNSDNDDRRMFVQFLPSRSRAEYISNLYFKYAAWMYDPITQNELEADVLDHIYDESGYLDLDAIHAHLLSAFLMVLAGGIMYDPNPDSTSVAKRYFALAKAAFSLAPIARDVSCATIQTLLVMFRYHYNLDRRSNEIRWLIIGICAKLAMKIGLHRDSSGWGIDPEEQQRRRRLFWELYMNDSWTSIVNGRPPSIMVQHTDCQFPEDLEPFISSNGDIELGWHAWKARYAASCLSISVQHIFITKKLPYSALLDLDQKIRSFPVPSHLQAPSNGHPWMSDPGRAMQQFCLLCERESNLLYLHRSYFAQALREDPANPLHHRYATSFIATYEAARRLIGSLKSLYPQHREFSQTCWFFWSGVFSACIVLGALVVESPGCCFAEDAFEEFKGALLFFDEGSKHCRPPNTLDILETLFERTKNAYMTFLQGNGTVVRGQMASASETVSENPDVFEVLGGRPSLINRPRSNTPPNSNSPTSTRSPALSYGTSSSEHDMIDYYDELALSSAPQEPYSYSENISSVQYHLPSHIRPGSRGPPAMVSSDWRMAAQTQHIPYIVDPHIESHPQQQQYYQVVHYPQHAAQVGYAELPGNQYSNGRQSPNQDQIWRDFARQFGVDS